MSASDSRISVDNNNNNKNKSNVMRQQCECYDDKIKKCIISTLSVIIFFLLISQLKILA